VSLPTLPPPAGRAAAAPEARAEFLLRLRARGIRDLAVLRVLEALPRELFAPPRYADLAGRDLALPIACGQTMSEPFLVASMVEALDLAPQSRVFEVGTGSGYATAVMAKLCAEVVSVERYRSLAVQAQRRLQDLGIANASVIWGNGLEMPARAERFDRMIVHAVLGDRPESLLVQLTDDAVLVYGAADGVSHGGRQQVVRAARGGGTAWSVAAICPSRLRGLEPNVSQGL
jgi:protein-L-isoaspartate(D-aspartate) O-methyltransferase